MKVALIRVSLNGFDERATTGRPRSVGAAPSEAASAGLADQCGTKHGGAACAHASRLFESTFHKGYVAHAALEIHSALADPGPQRMTVWASTQTPFPTRDAVATAVGLTPEKIRVITPLVADDVGNVIWRVGSSP